MLEASDWSITPGFVLSSVSRVPAIHSTIPGLLQFEGLVTVSNSEVGEGFTLSIAEGAFLDDNDQGNYAGTCTIQYETTNFQNDSDLCSDCNVIILPHNHIVEYAATVVQSDDSPSPSAYIKYFLQFRDSQDDEFIDQGELRDEEGEIAQPNAEVQTLSTLIQLTETTFQTCRLPFGIDKDSYIGGLHVQGCRINTYTREFRIKATCDTDGDGFSDLSAYSTSFNLYQYVEGPRWDGGADAAPWAGWEREFTTTIDDDYDFTQEGPALGKVGDQEDKLIISRFDMFRTGDTSGPNAFGSPMTPFKLCSAMVVPELRVEAAGTQQRWYGFQRLLVSSEQASSNKGSIQHYVVGSPDSRHYDTRNEARESLQESSHWFFEDRPFIEITNYSTHEGFSAESNIGYTIAPTRTDVPRPGCGGPDDSFRADVPAGFWFMEGTKLTFDETYGYQYDGLRDKNHLLCSTQHDYGYLINSYSNEVDGSCSRRQTSQYDLGAGVGGLGVLSELATTAQIATDGNGDTVVVSAPCTHDNNRKVSVLRTFGGLGHVPFTNSIHEIFSTENNKEAMNHWRPNSLCLNNAGDVVGYTYRDANTTNNAGHVAIWHIESIARDFTDGTAFTKSPNFFTGANRFNLRALFPFQRRPVVGLPKLLGPNSNLSVLKMDKSGNNIIVSCTRGKVQTEATGWAQVFKYYEPDNQYVARGQRLEGPYGEFGIDCDISSDGNSIVVSSREENVNGTTKNPGQNHHGAIRFYTWSGSLTKGYEWEQLGDTIRGTNYWSNLGFHLSYASDHSLDVQRIAAFEGTDQNDTLRGAISMYKFEGG